MKNIKYTHSRTYRDFTEEDIPVKRPLLLRKKKTFLNKKGGLIGRIIRLFSDK